MAKRFGRNQRRRMREDMARLSAKVGEATELLGIAARENREWKRRTAEWRDEIIRLLGEKSAFLDEPPEVTDLQPGRPQRAVPQGRITTIEMPDNVPPMQQMDYVILHKLDTACDADYATMSKLMRVICTNGDERVLAVSDEYMHLGLAERDVWYLANQLAHDFAVHQRQHA